VENKADKKSLYFLKFFLDGVHPVIKEGDYMTGLSYICEGFSYR